MRGKIRGYTQEERQEIKKTINDWFEEQFAKYDEKFFIMNVKWAMKTRKFPLITVLSVITGCRFLARTSLRTMRFKIFWNSYSVVNTAHFGLTK